MAFGSMVRRLALNICLGGLFGIIQNREVFKDPTIYTGVIYSYYAFCLITMVVRTYCLYIIREKNDQTELVLKGKKHGLKPMQEKKMTIRQYDFDKNMWQSKIFLLIFVVSYMLYYYFKDPVVAVVTTLILLYLLVSDPIFAIHVAGSEAKGDLARPFGAASPFSSSANITTIEKKAELDALLEKHSKKPVVVDFYATWCEPCRQLAPSVEEFANERRKDVVFAKCDVDDADALAVEMDIQSVPTFAIFSEGKLVEKWSGAEIATLKSKVEPLIPSKKKN